MKVTLRDIAQQVNVSISTVSRVLNHSPCSVSEELRAQIFRIAENSGYKRYRRADSAAKKTGEKQIGCVVYKLKDKYQDPYFSEILYGIERELLDQGYLLSFTCDSQDLIRSKYEGFWQGNQSGVICVGPMPANFLKDLTHRVNFLMSIGGIPVHDIDSVTVDFTQAAQVAINHLIQLGHRRIACIGGESTSIGTLMEEEARFISYMKTLSSNGIEIFPEYIQNGNFNEMDSYLAMQKILTCKQLPTALFAVSDRTAYGAYKAIREHGLSVPDDIAVVSFDDLKMSEFVDPPLTTVKVHKEELGRIGVKLLIARMNGNIRLPLTTYLPTELIVRESCGQYKKLEKGKGM